MPATEMHDVIILLYFLHCYDISDLKKDQYLLPEVSCAVACVLKPRSGNAEIALVKLLLKMNTHCIF